MPELPEVETICRGIQKPLQAKIFKKIIIRQPQLRWPIPKSICKLLPGIEVGDISRRAKYLLLQTSRGTLIIHLGMSGYLRLHPILPKATKHDHVDFVFNDISLRYTDPRRFGAILWSEDDINNHPLFLHLGPEPLSSDFNARYLFNKLKNKKTAIKTAIMNSQIVVGVGNIYAAEALFLAGIYPGESAGDVTQLQITKLCQAIKKKLKQAIKAGGTTLKDFQASDGKPGYFAQQLTVYGRETKPCLICQTPLKNIIINQRASVYCSTCQSR